MSTMSCDELEELAPELAIGTLAGSERAAALDHLETCTRCRNLVDDLAATADSLLLLAPEAEPPIGFESRAAARLAQVAAPSRPTGMRPRRAGGIRRLVAVAAAAFVIGGVGAGAAAWSAARHHGSSPAALVRTAVVDASNGYTCHAVAVGSKPAWVYVTIAQPEQHDGSYLVEAVTTSGSSPRSLGTVVIHDGKGSLGTPVDVDLHQLRSLRVLDTDGAVRYEAVFTSPGAAAPTTVAAGWVE